MTGGEAALKDARFPQFAAQIGSPTPRFAAPPASLTAAPPPAPEAPSSIGKTDKGDGHDDDFSYPQDELLALRRAEAALTAAEPVAAVAVERLNFNYAIEGDAPPWRPVRAFDDGRQVFIEFPPTLESTDAPPLFVIGASGKPELVNYRKRGRYYVVDRLFGAAELRLGQKRQQVVRIKRNDGTRQHKRRGTAS